jgi:hypothetical protein
VSYVGILVVNVVDIDVGMVVVVVVLVVLVVCLPQVLEIVP